MKGPVKIRRGRYMVVHSKEKQTIFRTLEQAKENAAKTEKKHSLIKRGIDMLGSIGRKKENEILQEVVNNDRRTKDTFEAKKKAEIYKGLFYAAIATVILWAITRVI